MSDTPAEKPATRTIVIDGTPFEDPVARHTGDEIRYGYVNVEVLVTSIGYPDPANFELTARAERGDLPIIRKDHAERLNEQAKERGDEPYVRILTAEQYAATVGG